MKALLKEAFEKGRDYESQINPFSGKLRSDGSALSFTKWYNSLQSIKTVGEVTDEEWDCLDGSKQQQFIDKAEQLLDDMLICTRVWEAWGIGTMSQNDFINANEDSDRVDELAIELYNISNNNKEPKYCGNCAFLKVEHQKVCEKCDKTLSKWMQSKGEGEKKECDCKYDEGTRFNQVPRCIHCGVPK